MVVLLALGGAKSVAQTDPPATHSDLVFEESGRGRIRGAFTKGEHGILFDSNKRRDGTTTILQDLQQQDLVRVEIDDRTGSVEVMILGGDALVVTDPMIATDSDAQAAANLVDNPSYLLVLDLSRALGAAGRTGKDYPATMPVHLLALGVANFLALTQEPQEPIVVEDDDTCEIDVVYKWDGDWLRPQSLDFEGLLEIGGDSFCLTPPNPLPGDAGVAILEYWRSVCEPSCMEFPNPEDDCFGMCGPGCDCWSRICGDCCFHDFCAVHDQAVRDCFDFAPDVGACIGAIPLSVFGFLGAGCILI